MDLTKEKHFLAFIADDTTEKAAVNEESRTIRFVIGTNELDRDNEIVEPSAIAGGMKDFEKNPVCLACHQHRLDSGYPPVVGSWDVASFKATAKRCEMDLRFADTDLAETYWKLYKAKHMRAVSIGFRVLELREEMKDGKRFYIFTKIELYEISCVPVGSNRQALSKLKGFDWTDGDKSAVPESVKAYFDTQFKALKDTIEDHLDDLKSLLIPGAEDDLSLWPTADNPDGADEPGQSFTQKLQKVIPI
jgi:HK97 family phage prohead protease